MSLVSDEGLVHPLHNNQSALYADYQFTYLLPFEKAFDPIEPALWFRRNWHHSLTMSLVYLLCIYLGQRYMRSRPALHLRYPLIAWNWALVAFSVVGAVRISEELYHSLTRHGLHATFCYNMNPYMPGGLWCMLFVVSKVVELGDTAFIVARKRPLIFLHWYHHVTVLVYSWHSGAEITAACRWFMWMNFCVHSFMYTYYALRSMDFKLPRWLSMFVTIMQLSQMVFGCYIVVTVYRIKARGEVCQQSYENLYLCSAIYFTYFLLFAKFFTDAYITNRKRRPDAKKSQ